MFNGIILSITAFLIKSIDTSFGIYISNRIGAESVGLYELMQSVYLFFITLALSGINLATTRVVSEALARNNEYGAKRAITRSILFSLVFSLLSALILIFGADLIVSKLLHGRITTLPIYIMAITLPFISMSSAINGYFTAVTRVIKSSTGVIIEQIVKIALSVTFLNMFLPPSLENSCISLVLSGFIGEFLSFIYLFILYIFDKKRYRHSTSDNENYNKKILTISMPMAITTYIRSGLSTLKQLLIPLRLEKAGLTCSQALSKFGMVGGMVMPILMFPCVIINSFCSILIPEISHYFAKNNFNQIKNITTRIFKVVFIFSFGVFGFIYNFSDNLGIMLYNNLEVGFFLKVLSPLIIIMYLDFVIDGILKGLNEQIAVMKCNILDLFVSIVCIYFLLPILGIYGYIAVIYISELLNFTISIKKLIKVEKFTFDFKHWIVLPSISLFISGIVLLFLKSTPIFIKMIWFLIVYLLTLYLSSCITRNDFKFKENK